MTTQIFALILVVVSFAALFTWAFWPGNKARFEAHGKLILDADSTQPAAAGVGKGVEVQGEQS